MTVVKHSIFWSQYSWVCIKKVLRSYEMTAAVANQEFVAVTFQTAQ